MRQARWYCSPTRLPPANRGGGSRDGIGAIADGDGVGVCRRRGQAAARTGDGSAAERNASLGAADGQCRDRGIAADQQIAGNPEIAVINGIAGDVGAARRDLNRAGKGLVALRQAGLQMSPPSWVASAPAWAV